MKTIDRSLACLLGGAAGDALGYSVEFWSEARIFQQYGRPGISEYALSGGQALFSDDTQMTLFTATGLLQGLTEAREAGVEPDYPAAIWASYRSWYRTQTASWPPSAGDRGSWLKNVRELYSLRAPGNTCLRALGQNIPGSTRRPINHSKGCGGVMRVAPVGLFFAHSDRDLAFSDRIAAEAAALTHGHELGYLPAAALGHMIRLLAEGRDLLTSAEDALAAMPALFPEAESMDDFLALMNRALDLAESGSPDLEAIHRLGQGWVAEETLAISLFCALRHRDDFDRALIAAVNHEGDSDSTGAVTGNLLGAALGMEGIPEKFLRKLELRPLLEELALDLCRGSESGADLADPLWRKKYLAASYSPTFRP